MSAIQSRSIVLALFLILLAPLSSSASGEEMDSDYDGVFDPYDNCVYDYNPEQADSDSDGLGDACDYCDDSDMDKDGIVNCEDQCPYDPESFNGYQDDDGCPDEAPEEESDLDKDGIIDQQDNCIYDYNPYQEDSDWDGIGDACDQCDDRDEDDDGVPYCQDQCPEEYGPSSNSGCPEYTQAPEDQDKDGVLDEKDNCVYAYNPDQQDSDYDGTGDACESYDCALSDADSDKIDDCIDKCQKEPETVNGYQDDDGCPDTVPQSGTVIVFADADKDGIQDSKDNCPQTYNPSQADSDMDGTGDACGKDSGSDSLILARISPTTLIGFMWTVNLTHPMQSFMGIRPTGSGNLTSGITTLFVDNAQIRTCPSGIFCTVVIPGLSMRNVLGAATISPDGTISIAGTVSNPAILEAVRTNRSCIAVQGQNDSDGDGVRDSCDRCDIARACDSIGRQGSTQISCEGRSSVGSESYLTRIYDTVSSRDGCGCDDTDGIDYFTWGETFTETVVGGISAGDMFGRGAGCEARSDCESADEDYCIDDRYLSESYCGASGPSRQEVLCPGGCQDGRCVCEDTDGGQEYYQRGTILARMDFCGSDNRTLTEYTCGITQNGTMEAVSSEYLCPYGCDQGACQCADSDDGIDTETAGRIGLGFDATDRCISYGTGPSQIVREYFSSMEEGVCEAGHTDMDCMGGACVDGACEEPSCYDLLRNQGETDIDCGGPCAACQYMMVRGRITYEDGYSWGNESASTTYFNRTMMAPVRGVTVRFMAGEGTSEVRSGPVRTTTTDSQGRFTFVIPRWPGAQFFLRVDPENYAARVNYDYSGCNRYVHFYTDPMNLPATGNLDLGELPVYQYTDGDWHVYWSEAATVGCGSGYGSLSGQAAYFNLAEGAMIARDFIEANRDDDDTLGKVDIAYPKTASRSGAAVCSSSSGEISIPPANHFYGLQNPAYREKTLFHEYGHFVQSEISMSDTNFGSPDHTICTQKDEEFAMSEGWAEFLGQYLVNKNRNRETSYISMSGEDGAGMETPNCHTGLNEYVEGAVMAALWDLADEPGPNYPRARVESFDTVSNREGDIVKILDTEMDNLADAPDMCELVNGGGDGWRDRTGIGAIDDILRAYGMGGVVDNSGC